MRRKCLCACRELINRTRLSLKRTLEAGDKNSMAAMATYLWIDSAAGHGQ
jgi:hypothetical protein